MPSPLCQCHLSRHRGRNPLTAATTTADASGQAWLHVQSGRNSSEVLQTTLPTPTASLGDCRDRSSSGEGRGGWEGMCHCAWRAKERGGKVVTWLRDFKNIPSYCSHSTACLSQCGRLEAGMQPPLQCQSLLPHLPFTKSWIHPCSYTWENA